MIETTWTVRFSSSTKDSHTGITCEFFDADGNSLGGSCLSGPPDAAATYPELDDFYQRTVFRRAAQDVYEALVTKARR